MTILLPLPESESVGGRVTCEIRWVPVSPSIGVAEEVYSLDLGPFTHLSDLRTRLKDWIKVPSVIHREPLLVLPVLGTEVP